MQWSSVSILLKPLIKGGIEWQYINLNGKTIKKPLRFASNTKICIFIISALLTMKLKQGLSKELMGYVISAFAISVSLFMSLLVNIFDKFEKTDFKTAEISEETETRLIQKKNFFKKFISITSYLVILSILIIILCSITYLYPHNGFIVTTKNLMLDFEKINWPFTLKNIVVIAYRLGLFYYLMYYLLLTLFIAGSSYEYYISELNRIKIKQPSA